MLGYAISTVHIHTFTCKMYWRGIITKRHFVHTERTPPDFEIFTNFISRENHANHCEYQERFVRKYNETSLTLKPLQFLIKSTTPCHKYDVTTHLKFPAMDKYLSTTFVFQRTSVSGKTVKLSLHMHLTMFEWNHCDLLFHRLQLR